MVIRKLNRGLPIIRILIAALLLIICIYPVFYVFMSSVKTTEDFQQQKPYELPSEITFANYQKIIEQGRILTYFKNSIIITLFTVLFILILASMAGFGLSKFSFRGNKTLTLETIEFLRPTGSFFDSQLTASLFELVSFQKEFPYVSFFNFGETLLTRTPIKEVLWSGMWASLMLMLPIFFGELIVGISLAMLSAVFRGRWLDRCIMLLSVAGMSISYLALILFCQWLFGYYLNLFPVWGWDTPRNLALPVIVGIISGTGSGVRFYRTVFLNEMNREYLRTAVAKGCPPFQVYFKHLLKNAAIPIITRASTVLPFLFTGSLLLESFFGIPGLGFRGVDALNSSDLQTLKALVILGAFLFVFINLLTDLAYAWVDPRVRPK